MLHTEAKDNLKGRVEWVKPLNSDFDYLTFKTPESGRNLQEEHPAVSLEIINDVLADVDISESDFSLFIEKLKEDAILQMLHDVFYDVKEIYADWIEDYPNLYDYAIILKVTRNVLSGVINSTRLNETELVTKENIKRWYIDLNGLQNKEQGVYVQGFNKRYLREIERIRKVLFKRTKTKLILVTAR